MRAQEDNLTTPNFLCMTNDTDQSFYALDYALVAITCGSGLPLNIYVGWLIIRGTGSGISSEFFSLNLALTEIVFLISYLMSPFILSCSIPAEALVFFFGFVAAAHPLFQTCICVERYLAVLHPVLFLKYKPLRYKLACSVIIWMMALPVCVIFTFFIHVVNMFWFVTYMVLFIVMLLCCLSVLRRLCKPGPGEGDRVGANQVKLKAFRIISAVTFTQLLTIIGLMAQYFTPAGTPQHRISMAVFYLTTHCTYTVTHPVLFLYKVGKLPCTTT